MPFLLSYIFHGFWFAIVQNCKIDLLAGVVGTTYRQWGGAFPAPTPLYSKTDLFVGAYYDKHKGAVLGVLPPLLEAPPSFLVKFVFD